MLLARQEAGRDARTPSCRMSACGSKSDIAAAVMFAQPPEAGVRQPAGDSRLPIEQISVLDKVSPWIFDGSVGVGVAASLFALLESAIAREV